MVMKWKDTGGPAFPQPFETMREVAEAIDRSALSQSKKDEASEKLAAASTGMSLRDYFAAQALNGILAMSRKLVAPDLSARIAYSHADAMLAEREVKNG